MAQAQVVLDVAQTPVSQGNNVVKIIMFTNYLDIILSSKTRQVGGLRQFLCNRG